MRILLWNEIKWQQIKKDRGERHQWKDKKNARKKKKQEMQTAATD